MSCGDHVMLCADLHRIPVGIVITRKIKSFYLFFLSGIEALSLENVRFQNSSIGCFPILVWYNGLFSSICGCKHQLKHYPWLASVPFPVLKSHIACIPAICQDHTGCIDSISDQGSDIVTSAPGCSIVIGSTWDKFVCGDLLTIQSYICDSLSRYVKLRLFDFFLIFKFPAKIWCRGKIILILSQLKVVCTVKRHISVKGLHSLWQRIVSDPLRFPDIPGQTCLKPALPGKHFLTIWTDNSRRNFPYITGIRLQIGSLIQDLERLLWIHLPGVPAKSAIFFCNSDVIGNLSNLIFPFSADHPGKYRILCCKLKWRFLPTAFQIV